MSDLVDFDRAREARAPGFIIGGERFATQAVSFEDVAAWQDGEPKTTVTETNAETIAFIESFIVEEDRDKWRKLVARKKDPLTTGDVLALARWLLEQHTARPTMQPSSSGRGQVRLSGGSEDARPSPVAAAGA